MIILVPQGNLFDFPGNIGHGVNCAGAMGKGIALEFKSRWPEMYKSYHELCRSGEFRAGDIFAYQDPKTYRWILNLGTQRTWKEKAAQEYLRDALEKTVNFLRSHSQVSIAFPRICAGLGGIDWEEVKSIFQSIDSEGLEIYLIENSAQKT